MINRIPQAWLQRVSMEALVLHWTAGNYSASATDKEHYHFIVEGDLDVIQGDHTVADNVSTSDGDYAAHTRAFNTRVIGLSMACMVGAKEVPFFAGPQPLLEAQFDRAAECAAQLVSFYKIPVNDKRVLTHAEVQGNLGIRQNGKWDITRLPWDDSIKGAKAVGDLFRSKVKAYLA